MRVRLFITFLILGSAILLLKWFYNTNPELPKGDLYLNLITELIGILVTTILIDWLLERKKRKEETTKIALNCVSKLKYGLWIWLGTSRDENTDTLIEYLNIVDNSDEIAPTTQNLFIQIAITADETLILNHELLKKNPTLKKALKQLVQLKHLRDETNGLTPIDTAKYINSSIINFSRIIKYTKNNLPTKDIKKLSTPEKQEWRMYGDIPF